MSNIEAVKTRIETMVESWKGQFENPPKTDHINFSVNENNEMTFNGKVLCAAENMDTDNISVYLEGVTIPLTDGTRIAVEIIWPFEKEPYVKAIEHIIPMI